MTSTKDNQERPEREIIGWREFIDLPDWGVEGLLAKSDTGARGSAIDVDNIQELPDEHVQFDVVLSRRNRRQIRRIITPLAGHTRVRSSNGQIQERYKVRTRLRIGAIDKEIELSLVSRHHMLCRVLLGRSALGHDFLVDSQEKFLFGSKQKKAALKARSSGKKKKARGKRSSGNPPQ